VTRQSLQFHADPDELLTELLPRWLSDKRVHVAVEFANERPVRLDALTTATGVGARRVLVGLTPFKALDGPDGEFLRANHGFLVVEPGPLTEAGLRESVIGAITDQPEQRATWRSVLTRARRDLHKGAVLINAMGARFDEPSHLFSDGALALASQGVAMLAIGGGNRYELRAES
jgi:hypothetical protein